MVGDITYPNVRNCAALVIHQWAYYRDQETYRCERCDFRVAKEEMKKETDRA